MLGFVDRLFRSLDTVSEAASRSVAHKMGRRSVLHWIGTAAVGGAMVPMLPFNRAGMGTARAQAEKTDAECEYWRYCALDGFLCTCCGGTVNACPSNAQVSKVTWVGTCQNPADSKEYLISYNDCCGPPILWPLPVQFQSARAARLPHGRPQRHQLVHGQ